MTPSAGLRKGGGVREFLTRDRVGAASLVAAASGFASLAAAATWVMRSVEQHWASVGYEPVTCSSLSEVEAYPPVSTIEVAGVGLFDHHSTPVWFIGGMLVALTLVGVFLSIGDEVFSVDDMELHKRPAMVALGVSILMVVGVALVKHDTGCLIDVVHQAVRN
ncbi:MAG: hypothetical protein GY925_05720 [Actinomycetia bacterium]|nr:hypothetical protein [Actinomycetes bacterium]